MVEMKRNIMALKSLKIVSDVEVVQQPVRRSALQKVSHIRSHGITACNVVCAQMFALQMR